VSPNHTFDAPGSYTVTLTVTDNGGAHGSVASVVVVHPVNQPPVADASASAPTSGPAPLAVAFSSSGSHDDDGTIEDYAWDFGDGPTSGSTEPDPHHTYTTTGTYTATLTVTDDDGAQNTTSVTITVGSNLAPTAAATATPDNGAAPLDVSFDGTGSTDPESQPLTYAWDFGDPASGAANTASGATASHTYSTVGPYTATLTVTDVGGLTDTTTVPVTVGAANQPPVADASATTPQSGAAPLAVSFDSAGSSDADGGIVSYAWDFGDPTSGTNTASGATAAHTYATPGTYTATLTVTDGGGATDSATVQIVVSANQPPTAIGNLSTNSGAAPLAVTFTSSSTDNDGGVTSTTWSFGDGSPDATTPTATHTYSLPGTYTATLTVADAQGATDSTSFTVTATGVPNGRYVATTGTDTGDCTSQAAPCATVQYASDQATSGDTVYVAAGTYAERVGLSKDVRIVGANAGVAGSAVRGPESVIKGLGNAFVGSITDVQSTNYAGSVSDVSGTTAVAMSGITGAGNIVDVSGAGAISSVTGAGVSPIVVTTTLPHELTTGQSITLTGVGGNTAANGTRTVTVIDDTHFSLDGTTGNANYTSGGRWYGGPVVLTTADPHGLPVGSTITGVTVASVGGTSSANGSGRSITVIDETHLLVNGIVGNNTYTSGGKFYNILATVETATPHNLVTGEKVTIAGVTGTSMNGNRTATVVDATHFTVGLNTSGVVTALGTVVPQYTMITTPTDNGIPSGATVTLAGIGGNTAVNGNRAVTVLDATHFQTTVAANGDWTGGGTYSTTPIVIETATPIGLTNPRLQVQDVQGDLGANGTWSTTTIDATHLLLNAATGTGAYTGGGHYGSPSGTSINGATNASPIVLSTTGPHGLQTGNTITVTGVGGNTAANGTFTVTVVDANHVSLDGTTGNANYTSGGSATPAQLSVTVDGMAFDAQGDSSLVATGTTPAPLVSLYGGPDETIENSVFTGGTFAPACSYTCTTNVDYALQVQTGGFTFDHNLVQNFRRPVNVSKANFAGLAATHASVTDNTFTGTTSRALALGAATGTSLDGVTVTGNTFDSTGNTSSPAGMTITNGGNTISGNTFKGLSSGIYLDQCKKFSQDDNTITGNSFVGNSLGVYITVDPDGGQCTSSATEGTGGWVVGGGRVENLKITGNTFSGNSSYGVYHQGDWGANVPADTLSTADATCNYWGDGTAPTSRADGLQVSGTPTFDATPYTTSVGGACDGS
jgi:PKD repeat protein